MRARLFYDLWAITTSKTEQYGPRRTSMQPFVKVIFTFDDVSVLYGGQANLEGTTSPLSKAW